MILKTNFKFSMVYIGIAAVLAVAGCASDSSDPALAEKATIVSVMDPYAINCVVTDAVGTAATAIDATNSPGRYKFLSTTNIGEITATNCVDAATNKALPTFKAPAPTTSDESVVTPITTVITAMMSSGLSASEAEAAISQDFPGIDLLTFDPLACLDQCEGILVQSFSNQMTAAIVMLQAAVVDDASVITAFAAAYASGSAVDLTDLSSMTAIANAAGVPSTVSGNIADAISRVNNQINVATSAITSTSTPTEITAALTRMTAGVIAANNLIADVETAVTNGIATELEASIADPVTLVTAAEDEVIEAGFTSDLTTEDGLTGTGSAG